MMTIQGLIVEAPLFSKGMRQDQENHGLPKPRGRKPSKAATSKTVKNNNKKMTMTIQGLIWNCRGLRKKGVATYLKDLIPQYSFHFIGLQETMVKDCDEKLLRNFDPQQQYLWLYNSANGKSGGILVGVKLEFYDVGSF